MPPLCLCPMEVDLKNDYLTTTWHSRLVNNLVQCRSGSTGVCSIRRISSVYDGCGYGSGVVPVTPVWTAKFTSILTYAVSICYPCHGHTKQCSSEKGFFQPQPLSMAPKSLTLAFSPREPSIGMKRLHQRDENLCADFVLKKHKTQSNNRNLEKTQMNILGTCYNTGIHESRNESSEAMEVEEAELDSDVELVEVEKIETPEEELG